MLLYLVFDRKQSTVSTPLLAPSLECAQRALEELNPENLSDLILHPLFTLDSPLDLFLLGINDKTILPPFLKPWSNSLELGEDETEGRECIKTENQAHA